jgi:uncharacterized protein
MKFCISKINEKRINYNLNTKKMLPETSRDQTICHWVADIRRDPLFKTIIASAPFQRLADISFMGAIDYLSMAAFLNKEPRTRFAHSLGVAGLANFISIKRNYSRELRKHLIAASLLHDIGHAPLSHSVEPYLKESLGLDHHEIGAMIINGKVESSRSLNEYLQSNFDLGFIRSLIDRVAPDSDGGDLFSDKINIDTIDGIIRACECYLNYSTVPDRLDVARAAFFPDTEERLSVLEIFWGLKNIVYKDLVHSATSVLADSFSSSYSMGYPAFPGIKKFLPDTPAPKQPTMPGITGLMNLPWVTRVFRSGLRRNFILLRVFNNIFRSSLRVCHELNVTIVDVIPLIFVSQAKIATADNSDYC